MASALLRLSHLRVRERPSPSTSSKMIRTSRPLINESAPYSGGVPPTLSPMRSEVWEFGHVSWMAIYAEAFPSQIAYGASKADLEAFTRSIVPSC